MGLQTDSNEAFVNLLLAATSRSALATSFDKAARFLNAADSKLAYVKDVDSADIQGAINSSGGIEQWMKENRLMMMRFLQFHAEIACVSRKFDGCLAKVIII